MIVAERKKIEEIKTMLGEDFSRLLIVGCGTCVTVSMAGGEREVKALAELLKLYYKKNGLADQARGGSDTDAGPVFNTATIKRQCDFEFVDEIEEEAGECDLILSLGCGVGVQHLAERFPDKIVLPGLNTSFYGATTGVGEWAERCIGCGNCVLDKYLGVCPVARCSKSLLNGPCGGSQDGKCEVDPETDCGWELIYRRAGRLGKIQELTGYESPKDWQTYRDGGPRKMVNTEYFEGEQ